MRIGSGAGFSGDRLEPAVVLAGQGDIDYLALECLAERTIALAQQRKQRNPLEGYDPLLKRRVEMLLPILKRKRIRLISSFGAANPLAAADAVIEIAKRQKLSVKVAVVTGDDVFGQLTEDKIAMENGKPVGEFGELISANAYLGAEALLPALATGADVVITGRVADPSLFVAPIAHHFGWHMTELDRVARATVVGHLLECAGQVCGGYFADPGVKDVPDMAHIGFPYADVDAEGNAVLGKVEGTGGAITLATVKEQLLYEASDPSAYVTPDVTADFSGVRLERLGRDRIAITGGRASGKSPLLKVSVGYRAGFLGEGEISYAGRNALARARLAGAILRERLDAIFPELRVDLIGSTSSHGRSFDAAENPYEIRLRVAGRASTAEEAGIIGEEVEALYLNGPAGGGGARRLITEQIGIVSTLIDRGAVTPQVTVKQWCHEPATI